MFENIMQMMMEAIPSLARETLALLIVVDPLGNIPTFMNLTRGLSKDSKKKAFQTATFVGLLLLLVFAMAGEQILNLFSITLYDFMIAGGILLFTIAIRILIVGSATNVSKLDRVGVVPIACPLLVGPGAITATIVSLKTVGFPITCLSVIIVFCIVGIIFSFIETIYKFLGETGSLVVEQIMAMLLASIATGYVIKGVKNFF